MNDSSLLRLVNSAEKYRAIRPLLALARVKVRRDYGPVYAGLPAASFARNAYNADDVLLGSLPRTWSLWSTYVHDSLCGRYDTSAAPALRNGRALDRYSLERYVAALAPDPSHSRTTTRVWDRNNASMFPADRVLRYAANDRNRAWTDDEFRRLLPLYHDYGKDRRFGVIVDQNTLNIYDYMFSYSGAALALRRKVQEVAQVTVAVQRLNKTRDSLLGEMARLGRLEGASKEVVARFERAVTELLRV